MPGIVIELVLLFLTLIGVSFSTKLNITDVETCPFITDREKLAIDLINVEYIKNSEGIIDTLNSNYIVRINDQTDRDLKIAIFKCEEKPENLCMDNVEVDDHEFNCEEEIKKIGPWVIMKAMMSGTKCSHEVGTYRLEGAMLNPKYFAGIMTPDYTHYRMEVMFHLRGPNGAIRSCVSIQFDVIP